MADGTADCYSVWACSRCHTWLDSDYDAEFEEKKAAFLSGLVAQVEEWKAIDGSTASSPKDRRAATWALERIKNVPEHST
ncbi:hypothetical protein ABIC89_002534 [Variovorax boronicumulans]|uniref:hypothetical protein n=1 Tax=Variovorax boronicumulans TaxID=436515 RepID=UPI003397A153